MLNMSEATSRLLMSRAGRGFGVSTYLQGAAMTSIMPPLTSATLRHCDCRTPLRDIATLVVREQQLAAAGRVGAMARVEVASTDEASIGGFMEQWAQLYGALSDVGFMFMSDIGRL